MKRTLAPLALALALGACATPYGQPIQPFSETRISTDRLRVTYQGPGDPVYAGDQALLRAADIAVNDGYDWFVVENRYTEDYGRGGFGGGPRIALGGSSFDFGRYSGSSVGAGIGFTFGGGARQRVSTTLEVLLGRGPKPLEAYDARDVLRTLGRRA